VSDGANDQRMRKKGKTLNTTIQQQSPLCSPQWRFFFPIPYWKVFWLARDRAMNAQVRFVRDFIASQVTESKTKKKEIKKKKKEKKETVQL
jgi:hypothetical protein